jgi:hypothetical protein
MLDPNRASEKALKELPIRFTPRRERVLPKWRKSRTEIAEPKRAIPNVATALLSRTSVRSDKLLPR